MTASRGSRVVKRSLVVAGHATSISLEDAFWSGLKSIAAARGCSVASLVADLDGTREGTNLSSAIRVFVLENAQAGVCQQTVGLTAHPRAGGSPGFAAAAES